MSQALAQRFGRTTFLVLSVGAKKPKGKVWEVASIMAGWTTWGEFYSADVLSEACPLYEGIPVHAYEFGDTLNHLPEEVHSRNPRGLVAHQGGIFRNVKMGEVEGIPAMVGEIHLDTDELAATLTSRMESASPPELSVDQRIMFTIDADGRQMVRKILAANSLDIVTAGAAGGRFIRAIESHAGPDRQTRSDDMDVKDIRTADGLRQAFPELVAATVQPVEKLLGETRAALSDRDAEVKRLSDANAALMKEVEDLKGKTEASEKRATEADDRAKKAAHAAMVEKRVTQSKIPAAKVTDLFRGQLLAATDEKAVEALITDRESVIGTEQRATESVSDNGRRATSPATSDESKTTIIDSVFGKPEAQA